MMKCFSLATFSLSLTFNIFYYEVLRCGSLCSLPLWSLCSFLVYRLVRFIKFSNFMASNFSTPFFFPLLFPSSVVILFIHGLVCLVVCHMFLRLHKCFFILCFLFFRVHIFYKLILKFSDAFFCKSKLLLSASGKFWFQVLNFYSLGF